MSLSDIELENWLEAVNGPGVLNTTALVPVLKTILPELIAMRHDLKNSLDALWFTTACLEGKLTKDDRVDQRYVDQNREFVKEVLAKHPEIKHLP
jgi:hypothetical protein